MLKFGEYVNSLGGKYITAEDVGMSASDMVHVKKETDFVTGIPVEMGGRRRSVASNSLWSLYGNESFCQAQMGLR